MGVEDPLQWCGRTRSGWVVKLLNIGAIGAQRRGVLSSAAGGGRGIKTTERSAIPKILVIGFAIPLMR
jgi:hypothetical protein